MEQGGTSLVSMYINSIFMMAHDWIIFAFNCLQVLRPGLQKGPWTEQEDAIVKSMVTAVGVGKVLFEEASHQYPK